jgi:hypothetical protein
MMMMMMVVMVMIGQRDDDGGDGDDWPARFASTIDSIHWQCTLRDRLAKLASELDLLSEIFGYACPKWCDKQMELTFLSCHVTVCSAYRI